MSLRLKLAITYSLVVAAVVTVLGTVLYLTMQRTLSSEMDRRLQVRSDEVQYAIWPGPDLPTLNDLMPGSVDLAPLADIEAIGLYAQVLDTSGRVLATSDNLQGTPLAVRRSDFESALRGHAAYSDLILPDDRNFRVLSVPVLVKKQVAGVLQLTQSRDILRVTLADLRRLLLIIGAGAMVLAGFVGGIVSFRGLGPLTRISEQAAAIAEKSDFGRRLRIPARRDEVGKLAHTIDQLLAKVDQTLQIHRDFVADTSHELRNPLLAIRTNVELLRRVGDSEGREECIREALEQVERMSRLISDLLLLAQAEQGLVVEQRPVNLAGVVDRVVSEARFRARGQDLRMGQIEPVTVIGDEGRLAQILANLLDNAIKHTPPEGRIEVAIDAPGSMARLTVRDNGDGIAPEHLTHIFDRAYRVNPSQSGANISYGLGLAIVKYLTEAHGGRVDVESQPGVGSCFSVWLPCTGTDALPRPAALVAASGLPEPSLAAAQAARAI